MSKFPCIIGLLARSRSGKDTVCDYIIANYPSIHIMKWRLAQPIKDAVCNLYGFTQADIEGRDKDVVNEKIGISPRAAMVGITKHVMEGMGNDFFSRRLFTSYENHKSKQNNLCIIIPDVRYEHDLHEIRRRGGIIIKVERPDKDIPKYEWENNIDSMQGDVCIMNDSTIEELYFQIDNVMQCFVKAD